MRNPILGLPEMPPIVRSALLHDFGPPALQPEHIDWERDVPILIEQRLAAVALRVLDELGIQAPDAPTRALRDAAFRWTELSSLVSARSASHLGILTDNGIDFVVTKGPGIACAAKHFRERPYSDIDVFISTDDFDQTLHLLADHHFGEEVKNLVPSSSLSMVCREAVNLRSPTGGALDIHHRIPPWLWGEGVTFADVRGGSEMRSVPGGAALPCASFVDNLLVSALHVISDKNKPGATLMAWRDVLVLCHRVDPDVIARRAKETGLSAWLKWILDALPPESLPGRILDSVAEDDAPIPHRRRLAMMMPPGLVSQSSVMSQMCRLPVANAFRYAAGICWPSSEFLAEKFGQLDHQRLRWARQTIGLGVSRAE